MSSENRSGALSVLFLVVMIDMIGFGIVIPFLTFFIDDLASMEGVLEIGFWVALMMAGYSAAQFLFSPFWGALSDRIGRRPVLMTGLVGNTVFFTIFGLSSSLWMAFTARFLAGAFNANIAVAKAFIGDISDSESMAKRMGLIGAAFGLGFTIGPFLGGELSSPAQRWDLFNGTIFDVHPYLLPCLAASILSTLSLILAMFKLPESLPPEDRVKVDARNPLLILKGMFGDSLKVIKIPNIGSMIWVGMFFIYGFTIMHAVFILFTEMSPAEGGLGFSEADNGRVFAVIGLNGIIIQGFLIGKLTKRFGSRNLLRVGILVCGLGLSLMPHVPSHSPWLALIAVSILISAGNGLFQPSYAAILTQMAKEEGADLGLVMGAQESFGAFGRILGPLTGGLVWDATVNGTGWVSAATAFHLCGLMMIVAFFLQMRVRTIPKGNPISD